MCQHCAGEASCSHPDCAPSPSACACARAGAGRCPTCGHPCLPWYFGLGLVGAPPAVNDFLGGAGSESPGFDGYPASRSALLAAAREEFADMEEAPTAALAWLDTHLPDRSYQDRGDVLVALTPEIRGPELVPPRWRSSAGPSALPFGVRLVVPTGQVAVLVSREGAPLDAFGPGEHVLTTATAPHAAAGSRPPAAGFDRTVLDTRAVFYTTGPQTGTLSVRARSPSGPPAPIRASIRFSIQDPVRFEAAISRRLSDSAPTDTVLSMVAGPALERAMAAPAGDPSFVEGTIRQALEAAGLVPADITVGATGPGAGFPSDVLARLPPEQRALVEARLQESMRRRAAAGAGGPPNPSPSAGPVAPPAPAGVPPGPVRCSACSAPNPSTVRFCGNCGKPLPPAQNCPACGAPSRPGVKFCGNCGAPVR
ncbi:MAG TPA: zinc ribbon domain-containing protein [Thermoplasmata archaeon]|nr:zinc ribbon domain-containing protein [Thermoplasmata archaeon]